MKYPCREERERRLQLLKKAVDIRVKTGKAWKVIARELDIDPKALRDKIHRQQKKGLLDKCPNPIDKRRLDELLHALKVKREQGIPLQAQSLALGYTKTALSKRLYKLRLRGVIE